MKKVWYTILQNRSIAAEIYEMVLAGDTTAITAPGQFLNIQLDGFYLRRPISICDWDETTVTIIYKVVGNGTAAMAAMQPGQKLDVLVGLGNGFDQGLSGDRPLLIGGGVGVPPMYGLAKRLVAEGKQPTAVLGFNCAADVFYQKQFEALGVQTLVTTADGSFGIRGFVTDAMQNCTENSFFYTCGPEPMLRAVAAATALDGQLSFEARMGCGFGACMGCSCETKYGTKRICKEGPVLRKGEVIW
ncbi:MAG: dihydroorotate dehydrogenase electron transfer subunit [Oscillospiraceae bacterium]